ncbi:uncharacterized protein DNG_06785 [Cephalotrichum gorgonifer]|uniref:Peptidase_S8 domain-containing protein n=1 Tax=Cephalotrichum gorgonifer TaxID=2041049 RepID=A0AAE8N148_9PEZI|nr:uncharacterized protein DNG_06785 [Cephalotrichum gorgonifer]
MFCAASDQGQSSDRTYPPASNGNSFRIGAARSTGGALETVGDLHKLDFLFSGHEVVLDDGGPGEELARFREFEAHTGSSVATALAAGLAALIIECVRLGVLYTNDPDDKTPKDPSVAIRMEDLDNVREKEQMRFALKSSGTDDNTHNRYIEVWQTFSHVASVLKDNLGESSSELETIAGLARVFLRKGVVA